MRRILNLSTAACIVLWAVAPTAALAGTLADPVDCSIENLTPSVALGAAADYVVHLAGGYGSYSVTLSYGDNVHESRNVTGSSTSFTHWFGATGTYVQTATVNSAGSQAMCSASTSVY